MLIQYLVNNLVGSIYNPSMIITNTRFLESLSIRNFKNGIVEVIKMGAVYNRGLFEILENTNLNEVMQNHELLYEIMKVSIESKVRVIQVL